MALVLRGAGAEAAGLTFFTGSHLGRDAFVRGDAGCALGLHRTVVQQSGMGSPELVRCDVQAMVWGMSMAEGAEGIVASQPEQDGKGEMKKRGRRRCLSGTREQYNISNEAV